ncbi:DUF1949 domain-containing protein, partial [Xanthomonas citri pv. citri]|nr:DUF1949 domain-containing protein [Xanthomonas citri pv. citri]
GLVRAYSQATQDVIQKSKIVLKQEGYEATIEIEYKDFEKLKYFCKVNEINIKEVEYLENIMAKLEMKKESQVLFMQ